MSLNNLVVLPTITPLDATHFDSKACSDDKTRYSGANKWMAIFLFFSLRYFTPNIPVLTKA